MTEGGTVSVGGKEYTVTGITEPTSSAIKAGTAGSATAKQTYTLDLTAMESKFAGKTKFNIAGKDYEITLEEGDDATKIG